jgi:hypothetical protein
MNAPLSSAAKTIYPFYPPVHSLKNQTQQVCDEKPHDHIATTLAKRDMTGLSKSPDSPELVLPASLIAVSGSLSAVSEAPSQTACQFELLRAGAPDTALRLHGQVMAGSMLTSGVLGYSLSQQGTSCPANGYVPRFLNYRAALVDSPSCPERVGPRMAGTAPWPFGVTQEFTQNWDGLHVNTGA